MTGLNLRSFGGTQTSASARAAHAAEPPLPVTIWLSLCIRIRMLIADFPAWSRPPMSRASVRLFTMERLWSCCLAVGDKSYREWGVLVCTGKSPFPPSGCLHAYGSFIRYFASVAGDCVAPLSNSEGKGTANLLSHEIRPSPRLTEACMRIRWSCER